MFLLWFFFLFPCGSIFDYPSGITFSCGGSDARASTAPPIIKFNFQPFKKVDVAMRMRFLRIWLSFL